MYPRHVRVCTRPSCNFQVRFVRPCFPIPRHPISLKPVRLPLLRARSGNMYNIFTERLNSRRAEEAEIVRKKLFGETSKTAKEERVRRIYGKNTNECARDYRIRAKQWSRQHPQDKRPANIPHVSMMTFRPPRREDLELGNRNISVAPDSLTPRAAFCGGGSIDLKKTKTLTTRPFTVLPRLKQPMYEAQRYTMRTRNPSKEISGNMVYKYSSDKQRMKEYLAYEPKPDGPLPYGPGGKQVHSLMPYSSPPKEEKSKWKSHLPGGWALNRRSFIDPKVSAMTGLKYSPGLFMSEVFEGPSGSAGDIPCVHGVRPGKSSLLRARIVGKEMGDLFVSVESPNSRRMRRSQIKSAPAAGTVVSGGSEIDFSDGFFQPANQSSDTKSYFNSRRECYSP